MNTYKNQISSDFISLGIHLLYRHEHIGGRRFDRLIVIVLFTSNSTVIFTAVSNGVLIPIYNYSVCIYVNMFAQRAAI